MLKLHNQEREKRGVPKLRINERLQRAAQKHAKWMATVKRLSHVGSGGSSFIARIQAEGYTFSTASENVAEGQESPTRAAEDWMLSRGHRANVLNPQFADVGFGYATAGVPGLEPGTKRYYWCAVFATPR